jgi:ribokinase
MSTKRIAAARIVALGSVNLDVEVRAPRWPAAGETLMGRDALLTGGGKAANVALLARRLGHEAQLLARVGDDWVHEHVLERLRNEGVDLQGVKPVPGAATAVSVIIVQDDGKKVIVLVGGANERWDEEASREAARAVGDAPRGSVFVADFEVAASVVRSTIEAARAAGHTIVVDPSPADRVDTKLLAMADCVTPNAGEAQALSGVKVESLKDAERAGRVLLERGVRSALVKLHDGGCACVTADGVRHVEPFPAKVVDKTGAGDAFAGALAVALLEAKPLHEAARYAVACASLAVTGYGSQEAYPDRERLDRLLAGEPR